MAKLTKEYAGQHSLVLAPLWTRGILSGFPALVKIRRNALSGKVLIRDGESRELVAQVEKEASDYAASSILWTGTVGPDPGSSSKRAGQDASHSLGVAGGAGQAGAGSDRLAGAGGGGQSG